MTDDSRIEGLILRIARGDRGAFAALYHATSARLHGLVRHVLGDPAAAAAAWADLWVALWQEAPRYRDAALPAGVWLVTLARDVAVARARTLRRERPQDERAELADLSPEPLPAGPGAVALVGLDPDRAEALGRAWLRGEDGAELGRRFGMAPARLRAWLRHGLAAMPDGPAADPQATGEDPLLAAEDLLGLLPEDESRDLALRRDRDPALRRLRARWQVALAPLADAVAPESAPPAAFAAIEARLFPEETRGWIARLGVVPAVLGALAAALLALAFATVGG